MEVVDGGTANEVNVHGCFRNFFVFGGHGEGYVAILFKFVVLLPFLVEVFVPSHYCGLEGFGAADDNEIGDILGDFAAGGVFGRGCVV